MRLKTRKATRPDKRWSSPDGELVLCEKHVRVVWRKFKKFGWIEISDHELLMYEEGTDSKFPCRFCEAIETQKQKEIL